MKEKRTFVTYKDLTRIEKEYDVNYLIIYGGRNDGKSYAAKEKVLRDFFETGAQFTYLRRYDIDIKSADNRLYWADFMTGKVNKIQELSGKAWDGIDYEKGAFYLTTTGEDGKPQRGPVIGYAHALSVAEKRLKSLQFPDVNTIIYEEFCSADVMLYQEVKLFMNYVSTIARSKRISVYMIGNTVSKHNAFFREWELTAIGKQKPGTVDIYSYTTEEGETVKVGAYYTNTIKENSMFFGSAAKMISGGEWDSTEQPHLKYPEHEYTAIYSIVVQFDALNMFLCRFMVRGDMGVWYVTAKTTEPKETDRIISPIVYETPLYTNCFYPINDAEKKLFPYIQMGRMVYGDNLTGTEFKRGIKQLAFLNG